MKEKKGKHRHHIHFFHQLICTFSTLILWFFFQSFMAPVSQSTSSLNSRDKKRYAGLAFGAVEDKGKLDFKALNLWSSKSGVDLQFLFHFQSWSLSFGCNNAGIWTSFSAFPVFFSQPLWRNDRSSTSASLFKSLDALSQGIEVVRRDWCLLAAGQQRCQSWCNMAYGCLWRMYIFEYLSPCLSYNIRMTLNNATCKICRCHVCKHLQTIAAYLGIRLRPGCHSYVFQSFKERTPSRQKWHPNGGIWTVNFEDSQLCKVRHMVEHSLHLLLRERSKEFGEPSASRSFGWSDTDSLVQFDTIVTKDCRIDSLGE